MAEQQFPQYRPVRRQQVNLNLPGASVTPAASPVDTYFRTNLPEPSKSNEMLKLAGALAPFSKSLGNYLQFEMQNQQEEAKIQAEMDVKEWSAEQVKDFLEMSQEELKASGLLSGPVANRPDYYIAAKINAGKRLGDIAQQDIITKHGEMLADLTDPSKEINIAEALGGIRQEVMGEFGELGFYSQKGAAASIEPLIDSLTKKTIAARQERVEEENIENITVEVTGAMTAAAADATIGTSELQNILSVGQAQLEKYKAVGGKNPQDILFDALERAAFELVDDDPDGSEAAALLAMAADSLGPGGKPLAKPGTKAHERLLELEDRVEAKADANRNKDRREYREKVIVAEDKAADVVAQFLMDNPEGTELTPEIEAEIRQVFEAEGLDGSAASSFILGQRDDAKERQSVTTDMETYRSFERRLADGEVIPAGELVDALGVTVNKADYQRLKTANEANKETPEKKEEQADAWRVFEIDVLGAEGYKGYTKEAATKLAVKMSAAKKAFRREAKAARESGDWDTFLDRWGPGGSYVNRFRTEAEGLLKYRTDLLPEFVSDERVVRESYASLIQSLPQAETAAADESLKRQATSEWNKRLPDALEYAQKEAKRDSQIPGLVVEYMDREADKIRNILSVRKTDLETRETRTGGLEGVARMSEDQFGEEFLFETTPMRRIEERVVETLIAKSARARGEEHNLERALADLEAEVGSGSRLNNMKESLGAFVASKGKQTRGPRAAIREGTLRLWGSAYTLDEAKTLLKLMHTATGLDADQLLAGELPEGLAANEIPVATMRLFRDRAHYMEFEKEMLQVPDSDDGTLLGQTSVGRLVASLGMDPTTPDGRWTAAELMKIQRQLLED